MKFAIVLSGDNAPTPAPRVDAIPSKTGIGLWSESDKEIWQACPDMVKAALPARYGKYRFSRPWHCDNARVDMSGKLQGDPPFIEIWDNRDRRIATAYLLPVFDTEPKSAGQLAYEADLIARPVYHDGTARRSWNELGAAIQDNWNRHA